MLWKFLSVATTTMVLSLGAALPASAATTLFSDNFNAETLGLNATLSQWNIQRGSVDVIGNPGFFDIYPGNGRYLDLDGSTGAAGRIESMALFPLVVGETYRLSFSYGRNPGLGLTPESMRFGVTDNFADPFSLLLNQSIPTLLSFSREFTASAAGGRIFFDHAGGDNAGIVIDNVLLESLDRTAVVPVPAALPLMLAGLAGLGFIARRRRS
jgi:hypothetical protein